MFVSSLGILCCTFILADFFGYKEVGTLWLVLCWFGIFIDSYTQDIRVKFKDD